MKKYSFFSIFILFFLLYTPVIPHLSINILHIIGVVSWLYILFNNNAISKQVNLKNIISLYLVLLATLIYISVVLFFNNNSILLGISYLYWMVDIIPACIMVVHFMCIMNNTLEDLIDILLIVGTIQGVIAVLAFFFPSIHSYLVNLLITYGFGNSLIALSSHRLYGMAINLTFSTPILQTFLAILAFYLSIYKNIKYLLFIPLLTFSALINARTSIVIALIGLIIIIISKKKITSKQFFNLIGMVVVGIIAFIIGMNIIRERASATYQWITDGYNEIISFLQGNFSNGYYFSYISDQEVYRLPDGIGVLFGVGERTLGGNKYNMASDIGYINDIWFGGILYCLIIYVLFIILIFSVYNMHDIKYKLNKFLAFFLFGIVVVSNIKGIIINNNEITTIILLFFILINKIPERYEISDI